MVYVGSDWVELDYWTSPSWGDYDARMRVLAYSTQDIASNTSRIYFKLQKRVTGGSAYNLDDISFRITGTGAGGDGHSATQDWSFGSVSSTSWQDVGGNTSDMYWSGVKHNDDGTLTLTANATGGRPLGGSFDSDITIQLPTIARASVPTASPNPATIGSGGRVVTINTNRKSSSFLHTVSLRCGSWTWSSAAKGVGGSVNVTIPYSVIAQFAATSKTATCTITCVTYSGNTNIGTKTATFTLQIDTATDHPQVDSVTVEDLNTKSAAIEAAGSFINNASYLKATIDLSAVGTYTELASARVVCGSTAQSYTLSGTSQTIIFEYDKINTSDLTVYVTDKRGTTVSFVKSWTLVPYVDLTVSSSVDRLSETGNTIKFTLTGRCFAGNFGQATNQLTIKYKSKLHSAADYPAQWTTIGTVTPSGQGATTYETSGTLTGFDYDQQYDLIFHVEDLFTEAQTGNIGLTKGIPVYGNGEDFFAVYGDSFLHWDRTNPSKFWNINDALNGIMAHGAQKNLAIYDPKTVTVQGITYHVYVNGGVRITGTATGYSSCNVGAFMAVDGEEYILSGCPEGGGSRTYSVGVGSVHDYGDGATVTGNGLQYIYIDVFAGETVDLTICPMVRDARIANEEFETPLLCTRYFTSSSVSVSANSSASTNISITVPSGYRVLAILRSWTNGDILTNYISTSTQSLQQGQTSVTAWVRNPKSSASNVTVSVEVLFIRA